MNLQDRLYLEGRTDLILHILLGTKSKFINRSLYDFYTRNLYYHEQMFEIN